MYVYSSPYVTSPMTVIGSTGLLAGLIHVRASLLAQYEALSERCRPVSQLSCAPRLASVLLVRDD